MNIFDLIYIYSNEKLLNNKEGVNLGGLSRKDEVVLKISKYFHPDRK